MVPETSRQNWSDVRGRIKAKFSKLSDESLDSLKGNLDQLSGKLQTAYGYAKEKADSELAGFKASMAATEGSTRVVSADAKAPVAKNKN